MRYPASEKLEVILTVERSHLRVKQTLDMLGIPRSTFYQWYDLYVEGGLDALVDRSPRPKSVWNRIPDTWRDALIEFVLEHEALSTRELAVKYTDEKRCAGKRPTGAFPNPYNFTLNHQLIVF